MLYCIQHAYASAMCGCSIVMLYACKCPENGNAVMYIMHMNCECLAVVATMRMHA